MTTEATFGQIVRERRLALGLTQAELARRVNCATVTIRKIEYDSLRPSVQVAERLALSLNIPEDEQLAFVRLARSDLPQTPIPTPAPIPEEIGQEDLSGRSVRGFELGECIGTGGFGVVYRAVQPSVDRDVAIKIILPEYANHPNFIRRFEIEAQTVAQLEHPHIVPLYDYWRQPNAAYLIMRLLRGGSLESKMKQGTLPLAATYRYLQQVGQGLHLAHRNGVIHRDLKPANILLDEDDNAYLADFGIAKHLDEWTASDKTEVGALVGSPAYASPEQLRAERVQPQTDIYCLGIMLYELLTGKRPFPGPTPVLYIQQHLFELLPPITERNSSLPPALDRILLRATAKDPAERFPDVLSFLEALQPILWGSDGQSGPVTLAESPFPQLSTQELADLENPFKGLRAFSEADSDNFFGRDNLVHDLLSRIGESANGRQDLGRFLAVVGPSGSGKSSVVKAGLLPALRQGGVPDSEGWFITDMMPGTKPMAELAAALLRVAVQTPPNLLPQLQVDERGLLRVLDQVLPADDVTELMLMIDQFEEVFTLVADEAERAHFLDSLVTAVLDERSRLRVVITLRADFVDRPLQYVDFGELVRQRTEFVLPLSPDELEEAISQPVTQLGLTLEPGLAAQIIRDVGDEPGTLPLLQYALTELFEQRQGVVLTRAAYEASGGVLGALGHRAEEIYSGLDEAAREATRQLFLRLITLGEGIEDTRRRVSLSELESLLPIVNRQPSIVNRFGKYRLLTFDHNPNTRDSTVEVAHEALLREWSRLRDWLVENRDDMRLQRLLANEARQWQTADQDPSYLLHGSRLTQFEEWLTHNTVALNRDETALLQASLVAREEQQAAERERQLHEVALENRSRTLLRRLVAVLTVATLIATGLTLFAFNQRNVAQTELIRTERIRLASQAQLALDRGEDIVVPALLALQSLRYGYSPEADAALLSAMSRGFAHQQYVGHDDALSSAEFSPDGRYILTAANDTTIRLWDTQTGVEVRQFLGHAELVTMAIFSPDGQQILSSSADRTVRLWDTETGKEISRLPKHDSPVWSLAFAPNGQQILTSDESGVARLWDIQTAQVLQEFQGHTDVILWSEFSANGRTLVTGSLDKTARLWNVGTGQELRQFVGHAGSVSSVKFSPDERWLLTAGFDNTARLWDATTGQELRTFIGHTGILFDADFSPDSQLIVTGSLDKTVRLWDIASGQELRRFVGHTAGVDITIFSVDGRYILTASVDRTAQLWDIYSESEPRIFSLPLRTIHSATMIWVGSTQDNQQVITGMANGDVLYWHSQTGQILTKSKLDSNGFFNDMDLSADKTLAVTATGEGLVQLWDTQSGQEIHTFNGHTGPIWDVQLASDGRMILTGGDDQTARLWDAQTGQELLTLVGHTGAINGVAFAPDGRTVLTGSQDGTARLWDMTTGNTINQFVGHSGPIRGVTFSPDGHQILTGSDDATAWLWDVQTGQTIHQLVGHTDSVWVVAFSPNSQQVLTGSDDQTARLWNVSTGVTVRQFVGHVASIRSLAFITYGHQIITADFNAGYLWQSSLEAIIAEVCAQLPRDFTDEERALYNISDDRPTCQP